ncbi:hypothetical protein OAS86_06965, partial [Gammaproteobacteria bacterium]|nr:hypothetical protein [Gammaproteobacteria bacterium]
PEEPLNCAISSNDRAKTSEKLRMVAQSLLRAAGCGAQAVEYMQRLASDTPGSRPRQPYPECSFQGFLNPIPDASSRGNVLQLQWMTF